MTIPNCLFRALPLRVLYWYYDKVCWKLTQLDGEIAQCHSLLEDVEEQEYTEIFRAHLRHRLREAELERVMRTAESKRLEALIHP